jgi:hypothetical protein
MQHANPVALCTDFTLCFRLDSLAFSDNSSDASQAIVDMTIITFFYLLRPGEYTGTTSDDAAF